MVKRNRASVSGNAKRRGWCSLPAPLRSLRGGWVREGGGGPRPLLEAKPPTRNEGGTKGSHRLKARYTEKWGGGVSNARGGKGQEETQGRTQEGFCRGSSTNSMAAGVKMQYLRKKRGATSGSQKTGEKDGKVKRGNSRGTQKRGAGGALPLSETSMKSPNG